MMRPLLNPCAIASSTIQITAGSSYGKGGIPCLPPIRAAAAISIRSTSAIIRASGLLSGWFSFCLMASTSQAVLSLPAALTAPVKASLNSAGTRKVTERDLLITHQIGGTGGYFITVRQRKTLKCVGSERTVVGSNRGCVGSLF